MESSYFNTVETHLNHLDAKPFTPQPILITPLSLRPPGKGNWYFFGAAIMFNDPANIAKLPPLSKDDEKVLVSFAHGNVLLPGRGVVQRDAQKYLFARVSVYLYGEPLTLEKFQNCPVMWISGSDVWDSVRKPLAGILAAAGAALAPLTFGITGAAGTGTAALLLKNQAKNIASIPPNNLTQTDVDNYNNAVLNLFQKAEQKVNAKKLPFKSKFLNSIYSLFHH